MEKKSQPLYLTVRDILKEHIESGTFKEDERIPPFSELAKTYNVSTMTIRQAISKLINEGYLETRGRRGTYVKNTKNSSRLIAVVFHSDIDNLFVGEVYSGIVRVLSSEGYHTLFINTDRNIEREERHLRELLERHIDGCIISPVSSSTDTISFRILKKITEEKKIPVVFVDIKMDGLDIDYVETDNFNAGYAATEYLIKKGHRKIGVVLGWNVNTVKERLEGYKKALNDYGLVFNKLYVKRHTYDDTYEETGYICGLELLNLREPPTAIFCTGDGMAIGIYKACEEVGCLIPDDISVIGFDNLRFTEYMVPPLTTVAQNKRKMGEEAANLLLSKIEGYSGPARKIKLKYEILERASVAVVKQPKIMVSIRNTKERREIK